MHKYKSISFENPVSTQPSMHKQSDQKIKDFVIRLIAHRKIHPCLLVGFCIRPQDIFTLCVYNVNGMLVSSPVIDRPIQMEVTVQVEHIVGMDLVIACSTAPAPIVIHIYHMDRLTPMNQVIGYIKVPIRKNSADVVLAIILHRTGIGYSRKYRILDVLREQSAAASKGKW